MGAVTVEARVAELAIEGLGEDGDKFISKGGASCQLLEPAGGVGVCAKQTCASGSAAIKKIFVFITRNLRRALSAREQKKLVGLWGRHCRPMGSEPLPLQIADLLERDLAHCFGAENFADVETFDG